MSTSPIVIVGGAGFLGARAVTALQRAGANVAVAGRSGPVIVDLARPETFSAIDGAAVVVNASSSHSAPPDALAAYCLERGIVMLECSSDRVVVERLLRLRGTPAAGAVVLGSGIYTGLSNLLGAAAAREAGGGSNNIALEIGIRSSPFSGAGAGTIDLMLDAMAVPAALVRDGQATTTPAALAGPVLPFPRGTRRTLTFSFPEVPMLAASTGAKSVALGFAPAPSLLWASFRVLPSWLIVSRPFRAFMGAYFRVLRAGLLRTVTSRVELVVRAKSGERDVVRGLVAEDGFAAAGAAIAALAMALRDRSARGRGVVTVDEVLALDDIVAKTQSLLPAGALTCS